MSDEPQFDIDVIRARHADMRRHYDGQDEAEFSLAAAEAIDDVPALLAEIDRLRADQATEGWERQWGARDADGWVFQVEDGEGEKRAQSVAAWPKEHPGTVVSRLVGPWETAEQRTP